MSRLRNRMIKAEFYNDPDLLQWPRAKRELYRSLWAMAEDSYCIEDSPFGWKVTAWPSPLDTDMTIEQFGVWRDELIEAGKALPYEADGKKYLFLPDMARHEKPRNPQSPNLPLPSFIKWATNGSDQRKGSYNIDWSAVQAAYNTATTLPALPCPDLPCPDPSCPAPGTEAAGVDDVINVRRASGKRAVTTKAAREVIEQYGYETALQAARSLVENVPPGGVRSPDALFRRRAKDIEPPPPPLPKRRKCDVCGGAGVVLDGDVARPCPECGAS